MSAIGWHFQTGPGSGKDLMSAERAESLKAYAAQMEVWKRQDQRRERAREIATIKAMQRAGLPVRRAVVDGVAVEFGQVEAVRAAEIDVVTPEQWGRLI